MDTKSNKDFVFTLNVLLRKRLEEARRVLKRLVTTSLDSFTVGEMIKQQTLRSSVLSSLFFWTLLISAAG